MKALIAAFVGCLSLFAMTLSAEPLPGFKLEGEDWTYNGEEGSLSGILFKPEGADPFPGILVCHGTGSSARGFSSVINKFLSWGMVVIATDLTHSGGSSSGGKGGMPGGKGVEGMGGGKKGGMGGGMPGGGDPMNVGACPENLRRTGICIKILKSLPYVDSKRLTAFGHSRGAMTVEGVVATTSDLATWAVTGGGTGTGAATEAYFDKIRAPGLMMTGENDNAMPLDRIQPLINALKKNGISYQFEIFKGAGHTLHTERPDDVYRFIQEWFIHQGILKS